MKLYSANPNFTIAMVISSFFFIAFAGDAKANPDRETTQGERRPGFFQRASDNIGGFFHRVFNADDAPPPPQRVPRGKRQDPARPREPRHNLDEPPSGVTPATPTNNPPPSVSTAKSAAGSTKSSPTKRVTGETQELKTSKPKANIATQEQKEVVVKNNPPAQKLPTLNKQTPPNTTDTGSSSDVKPSGKTDNTTTPKISQEQNVLTGSKTSKAGRVKSPYPPYNELDVSGLGTGSLALDPTTQKVFRVP